MPAIRLLAVLAVGFVLISGCTRSRATPPPEDIFVESAATGVAPDSTAGEAAVNRATGAVSITVERPTSGETVSSPVRVEGRLNVPSGRTVAAQVKRRTEDGSLVWLGNDSLVVDQNGSFEGQVSYILEEAAPGVVEVLLVNPASGTVLERQEVEVNLQASP